MKILGISGSLRKNSFSGMLLNAASKLAPEGVEFEIADISQFPMFNQDEEMSMPAAVASLKAKIEVADAVVIVTPEYNFSFSGVIKNAIDWISRPYGQSSFKAKPTVFMASSIGPFGGIRAWYQLQQVALGSGGMIMQNTPQIIVPTIQEKFDAAGELTDETTKKYITQSLAGLVELAKMVGKK